MRVWFRPACLARYSAASAAASRSVSSEPIRSSEATPTETVSLMTGPVAASSPTPMVSEAMCVRSRSAMRSAWASRVCGSRIANSSPPNRPARS